MRKNRMIVFEDMIESETGNVLHDIGINEKYNAFRNRPKQCPVCKSKSMRGIEILGAYDGPIIWGCLECSNLFRRFGIKETERMLKTVKDTFTNPEDWGWRSRSEFS
jgi:ribosomal protein L37AE/L43A